MRLTINAGPGELLSGDLIGFTTGFLLSLVLLALALRAARSAGAPGVTIGFALCALLWSGGGLVESGLRASGAGSASLGWRFAQALHYAGAAAFPLPILATWRPFAGSPRRKAWARRLRVPAWLFAATIPLWVWSGSVRLAMLRHVTSMGAAVLLATGAAVSLRRESTPRAVYAPSLAVVIAVCGAAAALAIANRPWFYFAGAHLVLLVVLCAFLLFARFRDADLFLRYGVKIVLAGLWAAIFVFLTQWPALWTMASRSGSPGVIHTFAFVVLAILLLLSFTVVDERLSSRAVRWLFRAPDYRAETRRLAERLRGLQEEAGIAAALEEAARRTLELAAARVDPVNGSAPAGLLEGDAVDLRHELLIPIASAGRVSHVLAVSPGPERPGLVTNDVDYLRGLAAQCGLRLDALAREREAAERQSREATLLQQVTEAELRALRAQINPHFLFNSLNTIADLIVRDPVRAEAMTVRLARVFRHVLAHSSRPLASVREEIEFLRTYLYIEEVRFGDRLRVEIDVDRDVAGEQVPSLILQPLVENALKHGLGPKPGPGRLWIRADAREGQVRLRVEDDGMGLAGSNESGTGLANIRERLRTLYQDSASLALEAREGGGTRATVLLPRRVEMSAQ